MDTTPTLAEYESAKQRQLNNPGDFSAQDPTSEVLADVAIIRAYEQAEDRRLRGEVL